MSPVLKDVTRPLADEYAPYALMYIQLVPDDNKVLAYMQQSSVLLKLMILPLPEEKLILGYAPGKWTIKEVLVHMIDTERIFAYRALCIARNEKASLPGYDENEYIQCSNAKDRTIEDILHEYESVREATLTLMNSFTDEILLRKGTANNYSVSVRGLAYLIAGHEIHHINVIKERYLN